MKEGPLVREWAAGRGLFPHWEAVSKPPSSPLFFVSIFAAAGALTSDLATRPHSHPIFQIPDTMAKAKLKKILDARQGRDVALEKQRKKEKAAEKRKAKNAPADEDDDEAGGVPLDEVEVKVNGKAKDSKNGKKAAKATEKEAEWETDGSEDEDDSEDEERPAFDLSRLEDSESDVSGDDEEDEEDEDDEEAEDIPLSDIESLASEDKGDIIPHQRLTINNTAALTAALKRIELPYSKLAFSEYQSVTTTEPVEIADVEDDLNRELAFYKQCLSSVKDARGRLKKEGASFSRPADYFAEMVKSDEHMGKIKQKLIDEAAGKKASAEARKQRDLKKFGKQVQVAKMQERAKEKRDTMEQINLLKRSTFILPPIAFQCILTIRRTPGRRHHKDQRGRPLRHWPRGRRL
jgi:rRNA-processing protein EBP2